MWLRTPISLASLKVGARYVYGERLFFEILKKVLNSEIYNIGIIVLLRLLSFNISLAVPQLGLEYGICWVIIHGYKSCLIDATMNKTEIHKQEDVEKIRNINKLIS